MRLITVLTLYAVIGYASDANEDLLAAVRKQDVPAVKALLDKGANVNAKSPYGATPLFFAADRGNLEIIKILLDRGAAPTAATAPRARPCPRTSTRNARRS